MYTVLRQEVKREQELTIQLNGKKEELRQRYMGLLDLLLAERNCLKKIVDWSIPMELSNEETLEREGIEKDLNRYMSGLNLADRDIATLEREILAKEAQLQNWLNLCKKFKKKRGTKKLKDGGRK